MGRFDGTLLNAIDHAESRHQFASRMDRDFELAAGHGFDGFSERVRGSEDRVERLGKARREAPANRRLGVDRGRDAGGQDTGNPGIFDEYATIHEDAP